MIDMPVDEPAGLQLSGFPYRLRRQAGGWFHSGFESAVYRELLRHKLPNLPAGVENNPPPPAITAAPAPQLLPFSLAAPGLLPLQAGILAPSPLALRTGILAPASPALQASLAAAAAQADVLLDEATAQGKRRIERNRREFSKHVNSRQNNKFVGSFYVSEVPVTWRHWVEVMGDADLPAKARVNTKRFLDEHQDEPAAGIGYGRCEEFCRRLIQEGRSSGQIGPDWEFTLPRAVEIEYLLKAGLSEANADGRYLATGSGNVPKRDAESLTRKCVNSWLTVEHNLEVQRGRRRRLAVWDADLLTNQLGVRLGLVATWTTDPADAGGHTIAGPSFTTRPNQPAVLKWKEDWPSPVQLQLPNQRKFVLHDINGYWPWSNTNRSTEVIPQDHVGMYLVLRNDKIRNKQFDDAKEAQDENASRPVEAALRLDEDRRRIDSSAW
jgi:hypothetical protein